MNIVSYIDAYALNKRKAEKCTWKDSVKERNVDFLLRINDFV